MHEYLSNEAFFVKPLLLGLEFSELEVELMSPSLSIPAMLVSFHQIYKMASLGFFLRPQLGTAYQIEP